MSEYPNSLEPDCAAKVQLLGAFAFETSKGVELAPVGAKPRAILAILASTADGCRSRNWLCERLWSEKPLAQAQANLRQCVVQIKNALAPVPELFRSDRTSLHLATDLLSVDIHHERDRVRQRLLSGDELLENLSIADPRYQRWLADLRSQIRGETIKAMTVPPTRPIVLISGNPGSSRLESLIAQHVTDQIAMALRDTYGFEVYHEGTAPNDRQGLLVSALVADEGDIRTVRVSLSSGNHQALSWARSVRFPRALPFTDSEAMQEAIFQCTEVAGNIAVNIGSGEAQKKRSDQLLNEGIAGLLTFSEHGLLSAEQLIEDAIGLDDNPALLAWQSMVKMTQIIEHVGQDSEALAAQSQALSARALMAGGPREAVFAVTALTNALSTEDQALTATLAGKSLRLNPANALAHLALSISHLRVGDAAKAYEHAQYSRRIAWNSRHRHWWDMFCALSEIATGRLDQATRSAELASAHAPDFQPPLRHLYPLYLSQGRTRQAYDVLQRIRRREPEFSLRQIRETPHYPAGTLRKSALIELEDIT